MYTFLIVVYVLVSAALIGLVLIQHGKGADAGAAFGSGASGTVFGSRGSANFLSRTTAWLAAVFFALSLVLAYFMHGRAAPHSVVDTIPAKPAAVVEVPAPVPVTPTAKTDVVPAAPAAQQQAAPVTDAKSAPAAAAPASKDAAKPAAPPATPKVPQ
ncbi:MAG: preprotein translocase subunit SecG [Nevskiales bacterium]